MEQRTVSEIINVLEPLLRKFERDENLQIDNAVEEPGSKIGDNYMSIVVRTSVTGKRGNGAPYAATFMTKRYPRHRSTVQIVRNADLFANEAHAYLSVLPRFGSIAPRCVYADPNDIIMEDLRDRGYAVCERTKMLDLHHCEFAIKALAHFHACSLILKLSNPKEFDALVEPLIEAVFPLDNGPSMGRTIDMSFAAGIDNLKSLKNPDDNLRDAIAFLETRRNLGFDLLRDLVRRRKEKYHVLTHGDMWNNNILFKHDNDGRVLDVKLLDFQIIRHASPALDFHYFVYSSAQSSVIDENYDDLVKFYQRTLVQEMRDLGAGENVLNDLSPEWFNEELRKMSMYGLLTGFLLVGAVLAEPDETIDMDTIMDDFLDNHEIFKRPASSIKVERLKCIALHYWRTYGSVK